MLWTLDIKVQAHLGDGIKTELHALSDLISLLTPSSSCPVSYPCRFPVFPEAPGPFLASSTQPCPQAELVEQ